MNRTLQFLLLVVVVVLSSATVAMAAGQAEGSAGDTVLRYMIWDANQEPAYRTALDIFEEENPGISVEIQVAPWSQYWTTLKTQAAGQTVPDLFWSYVAPIPELADLGILYDISDLIERDNIDLSIYNPTLVSNLQLDGAQYGLPKDWDAMALFYNKEILADAGYDEFPTDLSWNPEDGGSFVEFLQSLTFDDEGRNPTNPDFDPTNVAQYGFNFASFDPHQLNAFNAQNGGQFLDESGQVAVDSAESREAFGFLHDLIFKYLVAPDYTIHDSGGESLFYNADVAVQHQGSWMVLPFSENAAFEFGIARMPSGPEGNHTRINGLSDSIYSGTEKLEASWSAVKFLASPATQDILGETGTVFPAHPESIDKYVEYFAGLGIDVSVFSEALSEDTVGDPASIVWNQINEAWRSQMSLAYSGEKAMEAAIDDFVEEANQATN